MTGGQCSPNIYPEVWAALQFVEPAEKPEEEQEGSIAWWRSRAAEIQKEEQAARTKGDLTIRDSSGAAVAITLPGPQAPRHEDHPAFGTRVWPPVASVAKEADVPSWAEGHKSDDEEAADMPSWFLQDEHKTGGADDADDPWGPPATEARRKSCCIS